jgi:hypothetical protein
VVKDGATPPPGLTVRVCDSLSCEMAGGKKLLDGLPDALGQDVRVVRAPCMGMCDHAPAVAIGHELHGKADIANVKQAAAHAHHGGAHKPKVDYAAYAAAGGYALLKDCIGAKRTREETIQAVDTAGLRGLGGAGFPRGRKWAHRAQASRAPRLMAVNIDEGEPGTFKDRTTSSATRTASSKACWSPPGRWASRGLRLPARRVPRRCRALLERRLAALRPNPPPLPKIHLRRGAGAYICGEESAMIESIEGKRGMPRLRPPYVAQVGLFGRPTLEHNIETLFWVRDIVEKGPAWFAGHGRHGRKGLRSFSVSGRVRKPGVVLAPAGMSVRELIDEYCGGMAEGHDVVRLPARRRLGRHPAGIAGRLPLDFDTLQPHGCFIGSAAVMVLSKSDDIARRRAQPDAVLRGRVLRPVHALPRRHREGACADASAAGTRSAARRAVAGDARRVDLRPRAGGAEPGRLRAQVLPDARSVGAQ